MSKETRDSDYDLFAWFYNKYWGSGPASFAMRALPILDKLLLSALPPTARVLDLCCGTGQLAHALTVRGFEVMGIDASIEMLRYARTNAPTAEVLLADARAFTLPPVYHGAVSIYDSLNHVISLEDLAKVFYNVEAALVPGGRFLFDLNMDEGYRARWRGSFGFAENDHACVIQSAYDPEDRTGRFDATLFRLEKEPGNGPTLNSSNGVTRMTRCARHCAARASKRFWRPMPRRIKGCVER